MSEKREKIDLPRFVLAGIVALGSGTKLASDKYFGDQPKPPAVSAPIEQASKPNQVFRPRARSRVFGEPQMRKSGLPDAGTPDAGIEK